MRTDSSTVEEVEACAKDATCKGLYPFLPEFDLVTLPPHCANAVLGPEQFAESGQNALNLRKAFGMNLAGIRRVDRTLTWFPGAGAQQGGLLKAGDRGLLIRVPPPGDGAWESWMPSVTKEQLDNLMDPHRFRKTLNLDDAAWARWT